MSTIRPPQSYIDKDRAGALCEKWAKIINYSSDKVRPIADEHTKVATAILLENQEQWCIREANVAANGGVFGTLQGSGSQGGKVSNDFYAAGDSRLPKVLIPMIRRTFPELITNEIVGVQPMSGPVGLAFALRYKYQPQSLGQVGTGVQAYQDGGTVPAHGPNGGATQFTGSTSSFFRGLSNELGYQNLDTRFTGASSAFLSGAALSADFAMIEEDMGVADILANFEFTSQIPQIELSFEKTAVEAGTRRLAAKWSVELEQDIKNMNGIDIDAELTNAMSYEIQAEIDREMIMRMVQSALNAGTTGQGYSFWYAACADARWLGERNRDFYAKVIVEANRVAIKNRRGAANFIVATPRVCAMLEMLPEFEFMPVNGNVNTQPVGIAKVGSVGGRFTLYRDTRTEAQVMIGKRSSLEYALLGYKGSEYYDTGIIYCPYIPVMVQRTIGPNDFAPRVGLLTRYGVVDSLFGADLYYHVILVKNLGEGFAPGAAHTYL